MTKTTTATATKKRQQRKPSPTSSEFLERFWYWLNLDTDSYDFLPPSNEVWEHAKKWYPSMGVWCRKKAREYNLHPDVVYGVVAVTSPRIQVAKNLVATMLLLEWYKEGMMTTIPRCSSYPENMKKGSDILRDKAVFPHLSGKKVVPFFHNIKHGNTSPMFTVDYVMLKALLPSRLSRPTPTDRDVLMMTIEARRVSLLTGIPIPTLQAYVWLLQRSLLNNKYATGLESIL